MKTILFVLPIFLLYAVWVQGQNADSLAVLREVDSLLQVSQTLTKQQALFKALEANAAAEKLALEKLGRESAAYGSCCINRGRVFLYNQDYPEAEKWYLEAQAILEKVLGKEHPDYAESLNGLANLYYLTGNYEKAEALCLQARSIREKALGKEHPKYAESLNGLAILYVNMGNYEKAEPLYLKSKDIRENVLGKEHPDYASSLNNLGNLYRRMGNYEKAEALHLEAKDIREKVLGKEHPNYAQSLNNLAVLYTYMGDYEKAEALHLETKAIRAKVLGKEHPKYAATLQNLANLYYQTGNYEKAETLYLESKAICEKVLGKEHPEFAESLNNLGLLYTHTGHYEKAEALYLEAKTIWEKVLGKVNPEYSECLNNLALLYEKQKRFSESEPLTGEAAELECIRLSKSATFLSQRELAQYTATFQKNGDNLDACLLARPPGQAGSLPGIAFDHSLFHKGFLLTAAARMNTSAAATPESMEISLHLKTCRRRLAAEYAKPVARQKGVIELKEQANAAEKELARTVSGYAEAIRQVKWQEVQAALKNDEAAIEFVHFGVNFPQNADSKMYAALLLRPGFAAPQFIPLFEEKSLTALFRQDTELQAEQTNNLYRNPALYALIWQPLEQALARAQTAYFSPDGLLHRLNLRAIATPDGHILAGRYRLIRLNSTRQLVIPPAAKAVANDALLYGGIQYDMDAGAIQKANASLQPIKPGGSSGELDFHDTDSIHRISYRGPGEGGTWSYLPFSEVEATLLQHDLQEAGTPVRVLSGYAATEESFKAISRPSRRILHLATHGFFFPDPKKTVEDGGWQVDSEEPVFKLSDHPMIRSGLLLAGANYAWKSGQPLQPGMEDGILTAYEISQMDLSNTELAVLSACETGLGDIAGNEGVYGLQRAFKIAGVRYLLMSLWKIPDLETQQLMTTFYRHWLKDGQPVPDAFRTTQQEMREKYKDPFLWAGFILVE